MKAADRDLFTLLEEGDIIRECDFIIYGQIGYAESQLTATEIRSNVRMNDLYCGKVYASGMPEMFRITGSKP